MENIQIGRITYTVEREFKPGAAVTQLGWLHGPRGALAMVVRKNDTGCLFAMGSKTIDRTSIAAVHAALAPVFQES
jgi:hypothetical protein